MMPQSTQAQIVGLYRYPVKGLSPQALARVTLTKGETLPFDRAYAIENGPGRFDPDAPKHLPKVAFLMLMRDERLATLKTEFDEDTETLTILRNGRQVARGQLTTALGRQLIEQFMAAYMKEELRGAPHVVQAPGHSFSDMAAKCVHLVNMASVREVERTLGRAVDPLRFRANIFFEGAPPWAELGWTGKTITAGQAKLEVFATTTRCEATNVDPATGARDMAVPAHLQRTWGHQDFGIYAKVVEGGEISLNMPLGLPA
jgi:uncharacterized protein YcbX